MTSQDKRRNTLLQLHGVSNVANLPEVQDKRRMSFEAKRNELVYFSQPIQHIVDGSTLRLFQLNKDVADEWLNAHHPLQSPRGNVLSLGLVDSTTIYCVMTFKKSRNKSYNVELSRMWSLPGYLIEHGYDRLSQYVSELGLSSIVAYVNKTFENPRNYEKIGMKHIRDIQRTKWWISSDRHISDASRRQFHKTEEDLLNSGWLPVYDCGQAVYVFE